MHDIRIARAFGSIYDDVWGFIGEVADEFIEPAYLPAGESAGTDGYLLFDLVGVKFSGGDEEHLLYAYCRACGWVW